MPRARKPKATAAPAKAQGATPVDAAVPVPVEPSTPPAPVEGQEGLATVLSRATGTANVALSTALLSDAVASLGLAQGHPRHGERSRAMLGLMAALEPRDGVEGALAASFAALHTGAMQCLRRAANTSLPPEVASRFRRDAVALLRTANETMAAVQEHRGGAVKQVVRVEHIHLAEGAQAVLAAVAGKGREPRE